MVDNPHDGDEIEKANQAFDRLYLGIFDETDAPKYLQSRMLRVTFGADYASRIDFTNGDVLRAVLQAVDIMNTTDASISVVVRAKAQLLLDAAAVSQASLQEGPLAEYLKRIQEKSDD